MVQIRKIRMKEHSIPTIVEWTGYKPWPGYRPDNLRGRKYVVIPDIH